MSDTAKTIDSGQLQIEVLPDLGARLSRITFGTDKGATNLTPSEPTGFQMVPYSNRIRNGRFKFSGVEYLLANSQKHAIHGVARNLPWVVVESDPNSISCVFVSTPEYDSKTGISANFPFPFRATVTYKISDAQLDQILTIENIGDSPMPAGGGFHPYFLTALVPNEMIEICAQVNGEYPTESDVPLPIGPLRPVSSESDFRILKALPVGMDRGFGGWDGKLTIYWPVSKIAAWISASSNLQNLILYTPAGKNFCAIEPVANMTDGFNYLGDSRFNCGVSVLEPGQILTMGYSIRISANIEPDRLGST
jgi:aldose 1-epimerase